MRPGPGEGDPGLGRELAEVRPAGDAASRDLQNTQLELERGEKEGGRCNCSEAGLLLGHWASASHHHKAGSGTWSER